MVSQLPWKSQTLDSLCVQSPLRVQSALCTRALLRSLHTSLLGAGVRGASAHICPLSVAARGGLACRLPIPSHWFHLPKCQPHVSPSSSSGKTPSLVGSASQPRLWSPRRRTPGADDSGGCSVFLVPAKPGPLPRQDLFSPLFLASFSLASSRMGGHTSPCSESSSGAQSQQASLGTNPPGQQGRATAPEARVSFLQPGGQDTQMRPPVPPTLDSESRCQCPGEHPEPRLALCWLPGGGLCGMS